MGERLKIAMPLFDVELNAIHRLGFGSLMAETDYERVSPVKPNCQLVGKTVGKFLVKEPDRWSCPVSQ